MMTPQVQPIDTAISTLAPAPVIARASCLARLKAARQIDAALREALILLAQSLADGEALPALALSERRQQSARVDISTIWPERLTVTLTGLPASDSAEDRRHTVFIALKVVAASAPSARAALDRLLTALPITIISPVALADPTLQPRQDQLGVTHCPEHLMQPLSFDPGRGVTATHWGHAR